MIIIKDLQGNIILFRLVDKDLVQYIFHKQSNSLKEKLVSKGINSEFDVSIGKGNHIYLLYQNMSLNLILSLLNDGQIEDVKLTREAIPKVHNLDLIMVDETPHIFYCILLSENKKKYRIYHHYHDDTDWITHIVDEIEAGEVLNPLRILKHDTKLIIGYYDKQQNDTIFIKTFNYARKSWENKIKLIDNSKDLLYIDMLLINNRLHIVYCIYDENLVVKYERFSYDDEINHDKGEILSNEGNTMYPTLIYYENKLWVVWIENENIMSRYSMDQGITWNPIYLWNDSKTKEIVRYKYLSNSNNVENVLDYSFGTIQPDIGFIGFGPLTNTTEIPLKKKTQYPIFKL